MFRKYIPLKHGIPLLKKDKVKTIFPITSCWLAQDLGHRSRPTFFAGSKLVIVSSRLELFWILQLQESNNIELSTISVSNYLMSSSFFRSHFKEFPVTPRNVGDVMRAHPDTNIWIKVSSPVYLFTRRCWPSGFEGRGGRPMNIAAVNPFPVR